MSKEQTHRSISLQTALLQSEFQHLCDKKLCSLLGELKNSASQQESPINWNERLFKSSLKEDPPYTILHYCITKEFSECVAFLLNHTTVDIKIPNPHELFAGHYITPPIQAAVLLSDLKSAYKILLAITNAYNACETEIAIPPAFLNELAYRVIKSTPDDSRYISKIISVVLGWKSHIDLHKGLYSALFKQLEMDNSDKPHIFAIIKTLTETAFSGVPRILSRENRDGTNIDFAPVHAILSIVLNEITNSRSITPVALNLIETLTVDQQHPINWTIHPQWPSILHYFLWRIFALKSNDEKIFEEAKPTLVHIVKILLKGHQAKNACWKIGIEDNHVRHSVYSLAGALGDIFLQLILEKESTPLFERRSIPEPDKKSLNELGLSLDYFKNMEDFAHYVTTKTFRFLMNNFQDIITGIKRLFPHNSSNKKSYLLQAIIDYLWEQAARELMKQNQEDFELGKRGIEALLNAELSPIQTGVSITHFFIIHFTFQGISNERLAALLDIFTKVGITLSTVLNDTFVAMYASKKLIPYIPDDPNIAAIPLARELVSLNEKIKELENNPETSLRKIFYGLTHILLDAKKEDFNKIAQDPDFIKILNQLRALASKKTAILILDEVILLHSNFFYIFLSDRSEPTPEIRQFVEHIIGLIQTKKNIIKYAAMLTNRIHSTGQLFLLRDLIKNLPNNFLLGVLAKIDRIITKQWSHRHALQFIRLITTEIISRKTNACTDFYPRFPLQTLISKLRFLLTSPHLSDNDRSILRDLYSAIHEKFPIPRSPTPTILLAMIEQSSSQEMAISILNINMGDKRLVEFTKAYLKENPERLLLPSEPAEFANSYFELLITLLDYCPEDPPSHLIEKIVSIFDLHYDDGVVRIFSEYLKRIYLEKRRRLLRTMIITLILTNKEKGAAFSYLTAQLADITPKNSSGIYDTSTSYLVQEMGVKLLSTTTYQFLNFDSIILSNYSMSSTVAALQILARGSGQNVVLSALAYNIKTHYNNPEKITRLHALHEKLSKNLTTEDAIINAFQRNDFGVVNHTNTNEIPIKSLKTFFKSLIRPCPIDTHRQQYEAFRILLETFVTKVRKEKNSSSNQKKIIRAAYNECLKLARDQKCDNRNIIAYLIHHAGAHPPGKLPAPQKRQDIGPPQNGLLGEELYRRALWTLMQENPNSGFGKLPSAILGKILGIPSDCTPVSSAKNPKKTRARKEKRLTTEPGSEPKRTRTGKTKNKLKTTTPLHPQHPDTRKAENLGNQDPKRPRIDGDGNNEDTGHDTSRGPRPS